MRHTNGIYKGAAMYSFSFSMEKLAWHALLMCLASNHKTKTKVASAGKASTFFTQ